MYNDYNAYSMFSTKEKYWNFITKNLKEKMTMATYRDLYRISAKDVLKMSGQENSIPVNLTKILDTFNLSALPMDFTSIEQKIHEMNPKASLLGLYVCNDKNAAIFYNDQYNFNSHRCRFTIAHELAHCCLHGEDSHFEFRIEGQEEVDELELAANTFAGELLIPEESLNKVIDKLLLPSVKVLADIFDVSFSVMLHRLKHLHINKQISGYNY